MTSPATVAAPAELGWQAFDYALLAVLPGLLLCSAFFSGSETAFFGMSEAERMQLRRAPTLVGRASASLLLDRRMLLITLMLGNMTVNALYFVVSSVLMMRSGAGLLAGAALAVGSLLGMLLFGEVLPKIVASSRRTGFASLVAPLLWAIHRGIGPLRIAVEQLVVGPLSRLTAPSAAPPVLQEDELTTLLELSSRQGVIDAEEQRIIGEVFSLGRLKVRDVMTPRVRMHALPEGCGRDDVIRVAEASRLTQIPVYRDDLDCIVGMLHVKRYLLADAARATIRSAMTRPKFVPLMATLDQLLDDFRRSQVKTAIVVDEYGGTAGVVAIQDVVGEIVGEMAEDEPTVRPPQLIGMSTWRVSGEMSVHDWAEAFGQRLISPEVATLGGLVMQRLGRAPRRGDVVALGNVRVEVEELDGTRVDSAIIRLVAGPPEGQP